MWCYWKRAVVIHLNIVCGCKESTCKVGDLGSVPELGRFPGEGKGYPIQYSGLEKSMDYRVHGVSKIWTWLSNFHFHFLVKVGCFYPIIAKWNSDDKTVWLSKPNISTIYCFALYGKKFTDPLSQNHTIHCMQSLN